MQRWSNFRYPAPIVKYARWRTKELFKYHVDQDTENPMPDPKPPSENNAVSSIEHKLALLQAVFDEIPDVIVLKDAHGDFLLCNQTVARLYGTTPEAMVGKHDDDFGVPKDVADGFRQNVLGIMARGQTEVVFEDSVDAVTGERRHFKSIKRPFRDAEGKNQILVIAHDITDIVRAQQQVAESEKRLRDVMAATQEGIWDWQVSTGQVLHNDQWYRLLGFSEGEIADNVEAFSAHVHPDDRPIVWERIQALMSGATSNYHSEHRMVQKDGTVIWVQDRGRIAERDAMGQPVRVVGAYANITERRQHQVELEQALSTAQEATRAKSNFLATMSHELRTPLNGILGMAQMLQMPQVDEEARRAYARTIVTSGQSLLTLLNDILDLSKVEAGRLELDHSVFDLKQLVADTTLAFEDLARSKGLTLETRFCHLRSSHYLGDPLRLRQMVSNYLGNAIKFTPQGKVVLEVGEVSPDGKASQLEFSVSDSGIGIAAEKQALLFKPFIQADSSTTREFGGTGLGLSIVARLAELMHGQVGLESSVGIGSRFWFRVATEPQANMQKPVGLPVKPVGSGALSGRILVAEDNPVNRMVAKALLESQGLQADFVEDGRAAVDAVTGGAVYDLILMDIQMPVMDGQQATRCIRDWETQHGAKRSAIVALTAGAFEDDKQRCAEAGMDDFLAKPIELASLVATLTRWLGS
jgi:PAS domain S-box-containing protein